MNISTVSQTTGLTPRTIRYYEELGLLPNVARTGGKRVYGPEELERLRFIQRLKALGLSLEQIGELNAVHAIGGSTSRMLRRLDGLLAGRLDDLDRRIGELATLRDEIRSYRDRIASRSQLLETRKESA